MPDEIEPAPAGATIEAGDSDDEIATLRKVAKSPPTPPFDPETGEERHPS